MGSIRERLLSTEDDFLSAVTAGEAALEAFSERWHTLQEDVDTAIASHALDGDTRSLAAVVASRLDSIASTFEDILSTAVSVEASMKDELEHMFSHLILNDVGGSSSSIPWPVADIPPIIPPESTMHVLSDWTLEPSHTPSPASPSRSSRAPSLVSDSSSDNGESEDEDNDIPYISLLGKRCHNGCTVGNDETARDHKRRRSSTYSPAESLASWFWDDSPHQRELEQLHMPRKIKSLPSRKVMVTPFAATVPVFSSQLRKRRLSDTAADRPMKRPRDLHVDPRRHAVSNPLPLSNGNIEDPLDNLDHWAIQFTVVEPATFSPPTTSAILEIDWRGLGGSAAKLPREPVAPDFTAITTEPSLDEVFEGAGLSPADIAVLTTADVVAKATESEVASDTTDDHPLREPEDRAATSTKVIFQPSSPSTTQAPELTSSTPTESTFSPTSVSSSESDSVTQSGNTYHATTPLAAPADLSVPTGAMKTRSRSSSPLRTPPPSFESATADLPFDWNPPTYSAFDLFPETNSATPPPPYCHSPEESGPMYGKAFDANALFAELLPLAFSGKKRGFSEAFNQHVQVPLVGFAISVV